MDPDYDYDEDGYDSDESCGSPVRKYSKPRTMKINVEKWRLSDTDRKSLASVDKNFMEKFEEFLEYENRVSHQNKRNVMRQVWKLALGEGIRYEVCGPNCSIACIYQIPVRLFYSVSNSFIFFLL